MLIRYLLSLGIMFCQDYQPYGIYTFMIWSRDLSWGFVYNLAKLGLDNKYYMMTSVSQCELLSWIMLILLLSYLTCKLFLLLPEQRTGEMLIWSVGCLKKFPNKSIVICPQNPVDEESLQAVCLKTDPGCYELNEISRYSCRSIHSKQFYPD